jgi:hypothetical protein
VNQSTSDTALPIRPLNSSPQVPPADPGWFQDATFGGPFEKRFEGIRQLQRQATYPMDPVAAVRAQSQLAHVEVPWLTRQLQESLTRLEDLTGIN